MTVLTNISSQQDNLDMLPLNIKKVDFPFQRHIRLVSDITALVKMLKYFYIVITLYVLKNPVFPVY